MSGRRHHILPRFLLKGFAKEVRGDQVYVWRYSNRTDPLPINILNVAVEGDFYGRAGFPDFADPVITSAESEHARLIERLREVPPGPMSDDRIGGFVAHLSSRTKHLRTSFEECGGTLIEALGQLLLEDGVIERLVLAQMQDVGYVREQVRKALPIGLRTAEFESLVVSMAQRLAPTIVARRKEELRALARHFLGGVRGRIQDAVVAGHNRALKEAAADSPRSEFFRGMTWSVERFSDGLILGDSAALFEMHDDPVIRPYPEDLKKVGRVFLPIATDRLLIGRFAGTEPPPVPSLRAAAARCSRDFFVSGRGPEVDGGLVGSIGQDAVFFSRERLERIAQDIVTERGGTAAP